MEYYLSRLCEIKEYIARFRKMVIETYFPDSGNRIVDRPTESKYCWAFRYTDYWKVLSGIADICDMLGIEYLWENKGILKHHLVLLRTPDYADYRPNFTISIDVIARIFNDSEGEITDKLKLLDEEEMSRLNEAVNCYIETCNYATITMAVSSIEYRLFTLLKTAKADPRLDRLTLGELIREYLDHKADYKNIIPRKHEPLLDLCNQYRVFSIHPKKEKITRPITTSIINMAFAFLLDEELKKKTQATTEKKD